MDIRTIQDHVRQGYYLVKAHAYHHFLKEGFTPEHVEAAILSGEIIEEYPRQNRALVCGKAVLDARTTVYLHVVCEFHSERRIDIVTAYIPDPVLWETPPLRRKRRSKRP